MAARNQTVPTRESVAAFLRRLPDATLRADATLLVRAMRRASGQKPVLWGPAIIGFGRYRYRYASGREGEMPLIACSPRKAGCVLYLMAGRHAVRPLLKRLGPHRVSGSCLHLKSVAALDAKVLGQVLARAYATMRRRHAAR